MIKVGCDIVEISRFSQMKNLDAFIKKVFTKRESEYFAASKNPHESIAGAFAAKEAFSKYAGSGFRGFGFHDIELLHDEINKPYLLFMGKKINADVSISHSNTEAIAVVCGEGLMFGNDKFELWKSYRAFLPKRHDNMHKGDCGKVLVVAGSTGLVGAACLTSRAAMRSGSGLVTLALPECILTSAAAQLCEVMTMPLPCHDGHISGNAKTIITDRLREFDVCAIGPGIRACRDTFEIVSSVLSCTVPCVIDADGLNALSSDTSVLKNKNCKTVITPHPGEMARLMGCSIEDVENNREKAALDFASEYDTVVVLKGHKTVVAAPNGELHINPTGNDGMASGGMGDVLTGIIASFIGQGTEPFGAAILGTFLHGLSGDIAADEIGKFGLLASDVIDKLPYVIKNLADNI
ncbi:MAG: NAD(P)H-hydrate dehydratase [Clostridia bacterium]|nr:NAD(P)H-hydrate dehydratase [Clostridia bacterium]